MKTWLIIIAFISCGSWVFLLWWYLNYTMHMKRQLWNQKKQIILLIIIARKLGAPAHEIDKIEEAVRQGSNLDIM